MAHQCEKTYHAVPLSGVTPRLTRPARTAGRNLSTTNRANRAEGKESWKTISKPGTGRNHQ